MASGMMSVFVDRMNHHVMRQVLKAYFPSCTNNTLPVTIKRLFRCHRKLFVVQYHTPFYFTPVTFTVRFFTIALTSAIAQFA